MTTLLIHSSGLSGRQWRHLQDRLPPPSYAPDLAGYPSGPVWTDGPAWPVDHQHILSIIDALEGPIDLVGHSYGGAIALKAARTRRHRIRRLVVHEPVLWGCIRSNGRAESGAVINSFEETGFFDPETGGDAVWMARFVGFWGGPNAWEEMPPRHQAAFLAVGRKVFREVCDLGKDETPAAAFDELDIPLLLTVGEASPAIEREVCDILAARHPRRELRTLPGGHMSPVTSPDAFTRAACDFLS